MGALSCPAEAGPDGSDQKAKSYCDLPELATSCGEVQLTSRRRKCAYDRVV